MKNLVVQVKSRNGYPGGNEPETTVWICNRDPDVDGAVMVNAGGYGHQAYDEAVQDAERIAEIIGADLEIAPMGKYLSEL